MATLAFTAFVASFLSKKESQWKKLSQSPMPCSSTNTNPPSIAIVVVWNTAAIVSAIWLRYKNMLSYALFYLYSLSITLSGFCIGQLVPSKVKKIVHPITFCTLFTISGLFVLSRWIATPFDVILNTYLRRGLGWFRGGAGSLLLTFLSPAVVSFAFQMYSRRNFLQQYLFTLLFSCTLASLFGLFSTAFAAKLLQLSPISRVSLIPRSITVVRKLPRNPKIGLNFSHCSL